ncbi:MAG: ferredoxin [Pseudomonadales bacterium]|jgi:ferredoxin|nr:ferredoxin [Pseudomonadales bacterium]MDP7357605.1 ferredoxin [Pseudomonadales bacterium]MDP7595028.1 ferredoxin [Pseudomonadales bacterium]HJN51415.1 ferredoxin [Pseudomonadales bacterium]|tara:strand:- start:536 stop:727 length:192 start_codon:yes stop_codon:yes gene_type:complete
MKIEVDWDLCESNGVCVRICPDMFSLDENDNLIIATDSPDDELRDQLEQAVAGCPRQAMRLDD